MRARLLPLAILLAGCLGVGEAPPPPDPCEDPVSAACGAAFVACTEAGAPDCAHPCGERLLEEDARPLCGLPPGAEVGPPTLVTGTAWTYEGRREYDLPPRFTVVVLARPGGYLFAGATEADVVFSAAWGERWFGEKDLDLARPDAEHSLLAWPLFDGASWPISDLLTVTARAVDGRFEMRGEDERASIRYVYDPGVGAITELAFTLDGETIEDVRLVANTTASQAVWFEAADIVVVTPGGPPASFDLPAGFDAVIASAGGDAGGRALVMPPHGQPWSKEFPEDPRPEGSWVHEPLPATPGRWSAAVTGTPGRGVLPDGAPRPVGWSYLHLVPVTWLRLDVTP